MRWRLGLILALLTWPALTSAQDDDWGDTGDDIGFADTADLKAKAPAKPAG